jgi:hypothetical protein
MIIRKNIISAAALSEIFFAGPPRRCARRRKQTASDQTASGFQFRKSQKHGIGYFYGEADNCKLVLTLAATPVQEDRQDFTVARYEAASRWPEYPLHERRRPSLRVKLPSQR